MPLITATLEQFFVSKVFLFDKEKSLFIQALYNFIESPRLEQIEFQIYLSILKNVAIILI